MADSTISALPAASSLTGTELVPVVQGGVTVQATAQAIADLSGSSPLGYRVIFGRIITQTGVTTITGGNTSGFFNSVTRNSAGDYSIDFTDQNLDFAPIFVATFRATGQGGRWITTSGSSAEGINVLVFNDADSPADGDMDFVMFYIPPA